MSQTLLEMAKELVAEQIRVHHLSPDDANALFQEGTAPDWKRSITKYAITCLECGNSFRQLSRRHLRVHDLDSRSYRRKYGIPSTQPLSSRQATARRRELARQIRPWEQVASRRAGAEAEPDTTVPKTGRATRGRARAKRSEAE